jgi:hypothetical protein
MKQSVVAFALWLAACMPAADALNVDATALTPVQVGKTDQVKVGLYVDGSTDTFYLTLAGAYEVRCPASEKLEAGRSAKWSRFPAGFRSSLTVPEVVPAYYSIPGWVEWPTPSIKGCTFVYVGRAIEALVSFSFFGLTTSLGGGELTKSDTKTFTMVKPTPGTDSGMCTQSQ